MTGGYSAAFLGAAGIAAAGALLTAVLLRIPRPTAVESDHALAKERVAA